jgi:hypothetical protein
VLGELTFDNTLIPSLGVGCVFVVLYSQGWPNDYCRWVGGGNGSPPFWSCALAGSTNQYTPANMFTESTTYSVPCAPGEDSVGTAAATLFSPSTACSDGTG